MLHSDDRTRTICYNTCAAVGCSERIPYEVGETPEKYCSVCSSYHRDTRTNIVHQKTIADLPPEMEFRCLKCKRRESISKPKWLMGVVPECCNQKMIFHKEKGSVISMDERAAVQKGSIGWD